MAWLYIFPPLTTRLSWKQLYIMFVPHWIFSFVWYKSIIDHMVTLVLFMFDNHLESREKEPKQVLVWYTHCFVYIWLGPSHRGVWWPTGTKFNNKQRPKHHKHWNSSVMISKKVGGKTFYDLQPCLQKELGYWMQPFANTLFTDNGFTKCFRVLHPVLRFT